MSLPLSPTCVAIVITLESTAALGTGGNISRYILGIFLTQTCSSYQPFQTQGH